MSQAAAGVIAFGFAPGEDLGFAGEPTEGFGVQDSTDIAGKSRSVGMIGLGPASADKRVAFVTRNSYGMG
jgi:hypothetical protein